MKQPAFMKQSAFVALVSLTMTVSGCAAQRSDSQAVPASAAAEASASGQSSIPKTIKTSAEVTAIDTLGPKPSGGAAGAPSAPVDDLTIDRAIAKQDAKIDSLISEGPSLTSIPRTETTAFVAMPATMTAALATADVVVMGTVESLVLTHSYTVANVLISQSAKGSISAQASVRVQLGCTLQLSNDQNSLVFACLPNSPVLIPGAQAIMLLHRADTATAAIVPAKWSATLGTDALPVAGGLIHPQNPNGLVEKGLKGVSVAQFMAKAAAATK